MFSNISGMKRRYIHVLALVARIIWRCTAPGANHRITLRNRVSTLLKRRKVAPLVCISNSYDVHFQWPHPPKSVCFSVEIFVAYHCIKTEHVFCDFRNVCKHHCATYLDYETSKQKNFGQKEIGRKNIAIVWSQTSSISNYNTRSGIYKSTKWRKPGWNDTRSHFFII